MLVGNSPVDDDLKTNMYTVSQMLPYPLRTETEWITSCVRISG